MLKWAAITCLAQIAVFILVRRYASAIEKGHTAPALFLAACAIATGLINAFCIS